MGMLEKSDQVGKFFLVRVGSFSGDAEWLLVIASYQSDVHQLDCEHVGPRRDYTRRCGKPPKDGIDRVSSVDSQIISHEGLIYIIQGECYVAQNKQ